MKRGFPRPRIHVAKTHSNPYRRPKNGSYGRKWDDRDYPHPYTAADYDVAIIHEGRLKECAMFKLCMTCGKPVEEECVGLVLYNTNSRVGRGVGYHNWITRESGPFHLKCLVLNFTMCPHLAKTGKFMPGYAAWSDVRELILNTR